MKFFKNMAIKTLLFAGFVAALGLNAKEVQADPIPNISQTPISVSFNKEGEIKVPNRGKAEKARMELEMAKIKQRGQAYAGMYSDKEMYNGSIDTVITYARKYLGRPYIWGAKGPYSFDCSGYTSYVYKMAGIYIPSYTVYQAQYGKAIAKEDLKPGDLIFFNTYMSFGHVGIYLGNNQFIHASTGSKTVKISSFTSYYNDRYAGARRLIKQ